MHERLGLLASVVVVALVLSGGSPPSLVIAGVAAVLLIGAVRGAAVVIGALEMTVGSRARAHREAMIGMAAPKHPATAGRPRTRAPSRGFAA